MHIMQATYVGKGCGITHYAFIEKGESGYEVHKGNSPFFTSFRFLDEAVKAVTSELCEALCEGVIEAFDISMLS